ncbi:hypothetical protein M2232_009349 [Bradyrhizobium japonicum]|uniref:hypothetical protein n=1 Tax=Bradyrhizobium japonicum TaxID=375 RepID=UPI00126A30C9|nr:hypothetical protein [Bradyrhizobium japonicum]MCW2225817.1 hypothetical protein [Bradyrhizobium japonicum]MCW2341028.1 hypothetical protein [Bradyrhizobium japonicum]
MKAGAAKNSDAKAVTTQRNTVNNPELNYLIISLCDLFGSGNPVRELSLRAKPRWGAVSILLLLLAACVVGVLLILAFRR